MIADLKPCPFCGNKPFFTDSTVSGSYGGGFQDFSITIKCACGASMQRNHTVYPDGTNPTMSAIDMWNRRENE